MISLCKQGVNINICGQPVLVRGTVVMMLADTLAAHEIGGFKVGVSFSLRKCRMCLATKESMSKNVSIKMSFVSIL